MTNETGELTHVTTTPPAGEATPESVVGKLRYEIVESQRARTEFTKWKVFLRMMVFGRFLGKKAFPLGDVSEYEAFCDRFRPIFRLETLALTGTRR